MIFFLPFFLIISIGIIDDEKYCVHDAELKSKITRRLAKIFIRAPELKNGYTMCDSPCSRPIKQSMNQQGF